MLISIIFGLELINLLAQVNYVQRPLQKSFTSKPKFNAGVASGDPTLNSIILWTRVENYSGVVYVEISGKETLENSVIHHSKTSAKHDYIVKLDVSGLRAHKRYYYQFYVNYGNKKIRSLMGTFKTLPVDTKHVKLAIASCQNLPYGFFTPLKIMVDLKADYQVFLGDYIYEYRNGPYGNGTAINRLPKPNRDLTTLSDYRTRHLQYKQDRDLQHFHQYISQIPVWDDHEFSDNSWRNGSKLRNSTFMARKLAAMQAYFEYMPIRVFPKQMFDPIYRTFQFGKLFELIMMDTRSVRDQNGIRNPKIIGNPNRTLLGTAQENWLKKLPLKPTKWTLYGNQIAFAVVNKKIHNLNFPLLEDAWDAYPASRRFMIDYMHKRQLESGSKPIMLSGDVHISMHNRIEGIDELIAPAIASLSFENKHLKSVANKVLNLLKVGESLWVDVYSKGFMMLDIFVDKINVTWIHLDVKKDTYNYTVGKNIVISK
eukprot:NODE_206_length_12919_cov_0.381357.p3 type:complete len:484 gc:universal NODE_206_length_12919_cov_0.381357:3423-4874(+)